MSVTSNDEAAPILSIPPVPNRPCDIGTSCGVCANCLQRARVMCASMAVDAQKRRGKTMNSPEARHHARNKTMRLLCALGLLPEDMSEDKRADIERWVAYCEDMHALGMKGNLK